MKRKFTLLIAALALLTMIVQPGRAWGQTRSEASLVALTFPDDNSANNGLTSNQYTSTWTASIGDYEWSISNFNNNNWTNWTYIKCGRKNNASVATIISSEAYTEPISRVAITIDNINASKINSIKLYTSSNGSNWSAYGEFTKATGTQSVALSDPTANLYYKIEFDCASGSSNGLLTVSKVEYFYNEGNPVVVTPIISPDGGPFYETLEVSISCATDGATIYYTTDGNAPTTSSTVYSNPFTIDANTTVNAYAVLENYDDSEVATAEFTKVSPMSVAEAIAAIDATQNLPIASQCVTGIVCTASSNIYSGKLSYWISDDGTANNSLEAYNGFGLYGESFTAVDDVQVGDVVVIYGNLTKYSNTYEFAAGNYLLSLVRPAVTVASPSFSPAAGTYAEAQTVTMSCTTDGAAIHYTTDGTEPDGNSTQYTEPISVSTATTFKAKAIKGDDASNVVTATYHICSAENPYTVTQALTFLEYPTSTIWVHGIVSTAPTSLSSGTLTYFISDNGEAENELEVYKGKDLDNEAFTNVNDIQVGDIVTVYGNVIIYGTTNPIKEFAQGNYLTSFERPEVPAISVEPATINATAAETDGTLQVAYTAIASDRGITWYTDQTAATIADEPDWIIAEINATTLYVDYAIEANGGAARTAYMKVHGKSAANDVIYSNLVTINQSEYIAPTPSIAVTPTLVEATADETQGTITVTLTAIANNEIEVQWFESDGTTAATYNHDWVLTDVNTDKNIDYVIGANTGAARTAYFKVYGMDGEANDVYSELVTISQAAYVPPVQTENYELFSGNLVEGDYLIVYDDGAMNTTLDNSNRLQFVEVEPNNDVISTNNAEIVWHIAPSGEYWTIYNADADKYAAGTGAKNKIQLLDDATTDNALWTVTGTTTYEFVNKANSDASVNANLRRNGDYGFACYSTSTGGALSLYKKIDNTPSITINPGPYNLNADGGNAVLPVTTSNLATDPQLAVAFYESDGVTPATYDWISAEINGDGNVAGHIDANTGEARSAYFKVSGLANDNTTTVYSDLVTVNQAAYALSIVFETTVLNIEVGGEQDRIISFEYQGLGENPTFEVRQYDATGQTQTTYEWLTTTITQVHKVNITVAANTGAARSGYFKVYGSDGTVNTESNLVTINQAEYVAPTYTVTYNANGGTGTMTDPNSPYTANTQVTLLENTFTAPEGKIWGSWLVKDANQTTIAVNNNTFTMPASNVTVTAQWVDDPYAPTYEWVLTTLEDLTSNDVFVIVGTRDNTNYYGMSTDKGTSTQPEAVEVTIANNKLSASPADRIKWNLTGDNSTGYIFYPNGSSTTWLYCNTTAASSSNTNMRVGDGDRKLFIFDDNNYMVTNDDYTDRYVSLNGSTDWRGYVNTNQATTITFYKRQVASTDPQLSANDVNIASDETEGEITYTLENPVSGGILTAEITEGDWLSLGTVGENNVPFTCSANTEQTERTATVTLTYSYGENSIYATAVVTQAALVIDFATLPFEFNGGRADIENTVGLTQEGLDSDYGSSPKLKFNSTDDWMILKLNEAPKSLSYDIKGNGFSDNSVFTVQTSADGVNYVDLATYTTLGDVQSITHVDLDADVRYIKWIYTNKKTGNVALGNIHATEYYDTYGDVTLNDLNLTASSESLIVHSGSVVTLTGTVTNDSPDNLVIEDGGQLVFDGTGVKATMKKKTVGESKAEHWYTIASPVNNIDFANITNLTNAATFDLYRYDEATYTWENYKNTAHTDFVTAENGRGYLYYNSDGNELSFAGELNNSASYDLTASGAQMNGLNLIGNPFTQDITLANISLSDDAQISEGFYVLSNNSDWVASVTTVKPCEGFIVKVNKATTATFSKSTGSSKSRANRDYIAFTVANNQYEDVAYAMFSNGLGLDKINHRNADIPMVYIPQNGQNYAIATMDDNTQAFELNFKAMTTGQYTLSYKAEGKYSYLHVIDRLTGEDIDMLLDGEYSFIGSPRDNEARFIVKLSYNANIDEIEVNDNFAYQNGSDIIVNGNGELQVFDVTGRMVMNTKINGIQTVNVPATGMYIFRMVGESVQTQKIVVR